MDQLFTVQHAYLIPLLPLIGAAIAGFFGAKILKGQSHWPIWLGVGTSAVLAIMLLFGAVGAAHGMEPGEVLAAKPVNLWTWIDAGDFHVQVGYFFDPLTVIMLSVVCGIGFLITVFAAGYIKGETGYFRFFAYLGLFIFMMTNLVMGENLIMLYLGWEGVGLCSYLLIGYYYERPAAREAAKKAFLVNRIGDFGFSLGIMLCFLAFGTVSYFGNGAGTNTGLLELAKSAQLSGFQQHALKIIPFLLMLGAFGKSAQFPLYVWLPDAMEGPTPVSALIHAATMVTAGVYMIARCGTLFVGNHAAMLTVAGVGCFTALFSATIALRQFDLKKVFAYSTVSQLGFMFVGVGCLAPVASVFHLLTHAFFKALLFLSSGVVMHAMAGELDMRKM
ncbi:MAG: NADH-quinone oxidoreductase subunit L, partial [Phycisphaerae bacterium]|nr:NADH-quinone oxidoreductase subunit L [Phycisphaerae bacterium]